MQAVEYRWGMATVTKVFAEHGDGLVRFEYDYDDTTLRVLAVRCINNSLQPAWAKAELMDGTRSRERTFAPDQTTEVAIPTSVAQRLTLFVNAKGFLDGVSFSTSWPAV